MKFFNDVVDLGDHLDPWLQEALNWLIVIHIIAFFLMIGVVVYSYFNSPADAFKKEVERLGKEAAQ
jgi:predicted negative regulator of RcsB-dependent stress response